MGDHEQQNQDPYELARLVISDADLAIDDAPKICERLALGLIGERRMRLEGEVQLQSRIIELLATISAVQQQHTNAGQRVVPARFVPGPGKREG